MSRRRGGRRAARDGSGLRLRARGARRRRARVAARRGPRRWPRPAATSVLFQDGDDPFPREYALPAARARRAPGAGRCRGAHADRARLRLRAAHRPPRRGRRTLRRASSTSTTTTTTRASATINLVDAEASCTAEIVARPAGRRRASRCRRRRRGALRRPRDRHGPLPVREHDAARAAPGRAPARGGRAAGAASSRRSSSRCRSRSSGCSAWRSAVPRSPAAAGSLVTWLERDDFEGDRRRRRVLGRASSTTCARSRASSSRR